MLKGTIQRIMDSLRRRASINTKKRKILQNIDGSDEMDPKEILLNWDTYAANEDSGHIHLQDVSLKNRILKEPK